MTDNSRKTLHWLAVYLPLILAGVSLALCAVKSAERNDLFLSFSFDRFLHRHRVGIGQTAMTLSCFGMFMGTLGLRIQEKNRTVIWGTIASIIALLASLAVSM
jgi:hypothetical protein